MALIHQLSCVILLLLAIAAISAPDAGARSIKAYFNGQEATVDNITLRVGEPFTVDLYVTPDGDSFVYVTLTEPGYARAYDRISGDAIGDTLSGECSESNPAHFNWTLAANDQWVYGTAPVNIHCQLNRKGNSHPYAMAYFTVVDARILPALPASGSGGKKTATIGLELLLLPAALVIAIAIRQKASSDNTISRDSSSRETSRGNSK